MLKSICNTCSNNHPWDEQGESGCVVKKEKRENREIDWYESMSKPLKGSKNPIWAFHTSNVLKLYNVNINCDVTSWYTKIACCLLRLLFLTPTQRNLKNWMNFSYHSIFFIYKFIMNTLKRSKIEKDCVHVYTTHSSKVNSYPSWI